MRRLVLTALVLFGAAGAALGEGGWRPLEGPAITEALTDRVLRYSEDTVQDFRASGRMLYTHKGRKSWGHWALRDNQDCSQWPPNVLWACYGIAASGDKIRFTGSAGDVTDCVYDD